MVITRPPGYKLYTHLFHSAMRKLNHKIIKFQLLRRFINDFKNMVKFDKYDYSQLDLEFIETHIDKPWCWDKLSHNKNITLEFIEKYIDKPWSWKNMLSNPKLSKKIRIKYMDEFLKVTSNNIRETYYKPYAPERFWYDFTEEELELFIDKIENWSGLYKYNKNITENFIIKYIEKPWGNQIFMNEKMCDAYMEKHKINITNVEFITADFNTRIGLQFYRFMPLSYCIKFINNYEITQSDDYRGTKGREAWNQLSHNTNITKDFVKKYETNLPKLFIDGYLRGGRLTDEKNIPYLKPEQYTRSPWLNK